MIGLLTLGVVSDEEDLLVQRKRRTNSLLDVRLRFDIFLSTCYQRERMKRERESESERNRFHSNASRVSKAQTYLNCCRDEDDDVHTPVNRLVQLFANAMMM